MSSDPTKRLPQLDVLRGIAVLMVLGAHPVAKVDEAGGFWPLASLWSYMGWTGVNLFFVLSGFLVGGLLLGEIRSAGNLDPGRFIVRRMFKIWPSYYIYLVFVIAISLRAGLSLRTLLPFLLHIQNYHDVIGIVAPHTWSLAVEEHFYALLPLLLASVRSGRAMAVLLIACVVGCAVSRGVYQVNFPAVATHHNLDSLSFGVFISYIYIFMPSQFRRLSGRPATMLGAGLVFVTLGLLPGTRCSPLAASIVPAMLYLGYGMLMIAMLGFPDDNGLSGKFFRSPPTRMLMVIGIYSYSIYLWHIDIAFRLVDLMARTAPLSRAIPTVRWPIIMAGYVLLAVFCGILFGRCIEMPALALRDKLLPRPELAVLVACRPPGDDATHGTALSDPDHAFTPQRAEGSTVV